MGRASKDKRDIYYRRAKEEGFRARSAYKLLQIHEEFNILSAEDITTGAVDLCAAPGSWSQVLSQHFQARAASASQPNGANEDATIVPRIVAVDLQEMAPIEGVRLLQGDITSEATGREIIRLLNAPEDEADSACGSSGPTAASSLGAPYRKADIVVCDGAPDVTGMHELDEFMQHHLLLAALNITTFVLRTGGCFVTKMFRGPNTPFLIAKSELFFREVRVVKPKSSRNASLESFLLCQDFQMPAGYVPRFLSSSPAAAASPPSAPNVVPTGWGLTSEAPEYAYQATSAEPDVTARSAVHQRLLSPFLSCGDLSGFDADMCYGRPDTVLAPVQPPLQAPYLNVPAARESEAGDKKRRKNEYAA